MNYIESGETEKEYRQLAKLGQRLGVPIPQVFLEFEVTMPDGTVVHHHKQRSHSWVRNAYNASFSVLAAKNCNDVTFGAGKITAQQTDATIISGNYALAPLNNLDTIGNGLLGGAGITAVGIVVGSGTDAESFEGYILQTLIANGVGAGQLSYVQSAAHAMTYVAGTKTLTDTLIRYMNNNSGGNVSVNEVALYLNFINNGKSTMMSRDKLGATVTVPNTGQLKITATISLVYPA